MAAFFSDLTKRGIVSPEPPELEPRREVRWTAAAGDAEVSVVGTTPASGKQPRDSAPREEGIHDLACGVSVLSSPRVDKVDHVVTYSLTGAAGGGAFIEAACSVLDVSLQNLAGWGWCPQSPYAKCPSGGGTLASGHLGNG